jgi:hypothetical protein
MAHKLDRQHLLLPIGLIDDPVVSHSKLKKAGEGTSQGFRLNGVEVLGKPAKLLQHTISNKLVEVVKVLGRSRAKLDLIHLPFQAPASGQFSRGNIHAFSLRLLEIPQKAFPNFGPKSKTCVGVSQNFTELLLDYFPDKCLEFLD